MCPVTRKEMNEQKVWDTFCEENRLRMGCPLLHRPEKLETTQRENQSDHQEDQPDTIGGANYSPQSLDVWLGELLQTCHRLSEIQTPRCLDTQPFTVLYL